MNFNWTPEELQEIVFMTGSWERFALFLNVDLKEAHQVRQTNGLKSPTDYVRNTETGTLIYKLMRTGSFEKTAQSYGVSSSFLRAILKKRAGSNGIRPIAPGEVKTQMERYLSVRLATRMIRLVSGLDITETQVREQARGEKFDLRQCIDGHDTGYNSSFGRRAENQFSEIRQRHIQEDCNRERAHTAEYDFFDDELGKVNVKASKEFKRKDKKRTSYWKFSTAGLDKADTIAMMFYDGRGQTLRFHATKPAEPLKGVSTIIIAQEGKVFETWGINPYESNLSQDDSGPESVPIDGEGPLVGS